MKLARSRSIKQSCLARAPNISHGPGLVGGARPGRLMLSARARKSASITLQKGSCLGVKVGGRVRNFHIGKPPRPQSSFCSFSVFVVFNTTNTVFHCTTPVGEKTKWGIAPYELNFELAASLCTSCVPVCSRSCLGCDLHSVASVGTNGPEHDGQRLQGASRRACGRRNRRSRRLRWVLRPPAVETMKLQNSPPYHR